MAEKKLELRVIAPTLATDRSPYKYQKNVDMVIMRCSSGDLGVLPGRVACSMVLGLGILRIFDGDKELHMAVMGGMAHVNDDVVTILSDSAQLPGDINVVAINEGIQETQRLLDETTDIDQRKTHNDNLRRFQIQLDVAKSVK